MAWTRKQLEFNAAMERYNSRNLYQWCNVFVSITNIALQIYLVARLWPLHTGVGQQLCALLVAIPVTDFVNGLVHMYMDCNDRYDSVVGPLVANFHLHHKTPQYRKNNLLMVYFTETGSKVWLIGYQAGIVLLLQVPGIPAVLLFTLVYIGILSSVAEVSHYLCHSSTAPLSRFLGDNGILLSKRHHACHHLQDNTNYAFLNGMSDPLLNLIATRFSPGYKQTTDQHFAHYDQVDKDKRQES